MSKITASLSVLLVSAIILPGCGGDKGPAAPGEIETGTIVIDQSPGILAGMGWSLSGQRGATGSGDTIMTGMPAGEYTLTWHALAGYSEPPGETKTLLANRTITFSGTYVADHGPGGDFVLIPPGTFMMGSPTDEQGSFDNETRHQVTLTRGFYMSRYEVSEQWWQQVMGGAPTSSQLPKIHVSWDMAVEFCNALSKQVGLDTVYIIHGGNGNVTWNRSADGYRLPTEAEWEYACRAGSQTAFAGGGITHIYCEPLDPVLDQVGWYCGNSGDVRHDVGLKEPNAWGLYDMHGNVCEWVWDGWRADYENLEPVDPAHDGAAGLARVTRGGFWYHHAMYCRSAYRNHDPPGSTYYPHGFRPVRTAY